MNDLSERPETPALSRYQRAVVLTGTVEGKVHESDEVPMEAAVGHGTLPESVVGGRGDGSVDAYKARGYLRGFEEARDRVEESKYPTRSVEEELFGVEHDLTDRINAIDHSGRGSGCCQNEYGLKVKREAVRWLLTGEWGFSL